MTPTSMQSLDAEADGTPEKRVLRTNLLTMLDHILWLSQWSVNATSLTAAELRELEHHLTELDGAVRTVIAHTLPPASRPSRPQDRSSQACSWVTSAHSSGSVSEFSTE